MKPKTLKWESRLFPHLPLHLLCHCFERQIRDQRSLAFVPLALCELRSPTKPQQRGEKSRKSFLSFMSSLPTFEAGQNAHSKTLGAYMKIIEMQMPQTISHGHRCIGGWRSARLAHIFSDQMNINDPLDIRLGCDKDLYSNIITYNAWHLLWLQVLARLNRNGRIRGICILFKFTLMMGLSCCLPTFNLSGKWKSLESFMHWTQTTIQTRPINSKISFSPPVHIALLAKSAAN